jgi:hypothetical protein
VAAGAQMSEYASGTSVLAYKSSKHHAYVLSDTSGGRYSKKSELKSLLLVLDTLSSHLNLKRMTCVWLFVCNVNTVWCAVVIIYGLGGASDKKTALI